MLFFFSNLVTAMPKSTKQRFLFKNWIFSLRKTQKNPSYRSLTIQFGYSINFPTLFMYLYLRKGGFPLLILCPFRIILTLKLFWSYFSFAPIFSFYLSTTCFKLEFFSLTFAYFWPRFCIFCFLSINLFSKD